MDKHKNPLNRRKVIEVMDAHTLPAIILYRPYPPYDLPETNSFFGGRPFLPDNFAWPRSSRGWPLTFLAQIDLSELPSISSVMPMTGYLLVFEKNGVIEEEQKKMLPEDVGWQIFYVEEIGATARKPPDDLPPVQSTRKTPPKYSVQLAKEEYFFTLLTENQTPYEDLHLLWPPVSSQFEYKRWPVCSQRIRSWPNEESLPSQADGADSYWDMEYWAVDHERRNSEALGATGLISTFEPYWSGYNPYRQNDRPVFPKDISESERFPQCWLMVEYLSRYLATALAECAQTMLRRNTDTSYDAIQYIKQSTKTAVSWICLARGQDSYQTLPENERDNFADWLTELGNHDERAIYLIPGRAIKAIMEYLVIDSVDDRKLAATIPADYYHQMAGSLGSIYIDRFSQMFGHPPEEHSAKDDYGDDDVLLLHLYSDRAAGFCFGDGDAVDFWIKREALEKLDFSNVEVWLNGWHANPE